MRLPVIAVRRTACTNMILDVVAGILEGLRPWTSVRSKTS